jgi:hypothetical protein
VGRRCDAHNPGHRCYSESFLVKGCNFGCDTWLSYGCSNHVIDDVIGAAVITQTYRDHVGKFDIWCLGNLNGPA